MIDGGKRKATGLTLCGVAFVVSYLLGERYQWRGWEFVAPFLVAWAAALLFGWSLGPRDGLLLSVAFALASGTGLRLGLDSAHALEDPIILEGYATWVLLSLAVVPLAWLIGLLSRRLWRPPKTAQDRHE